MNIDSYKNKTHYSTENSTLRTGTKQILIQTITSEVASTLTNKQNKKGKTEEEKKKLIFNYLNISKKIIKNEEKG